MTVELKGQTPTIAIYLGKPGGGEDRRLLFDAKTGAFKQMNDYVDKPFLNRLHSGEAFGDGGLVVAMGWGIALLALTTSGFVLYWRLARANMDRRTGLKKVFF